jgi:hypothetical protein
LSKRADTRTVASSRLTRSSLALIASALAALALGGAVAEPAGAATVSGNWAGYVATPRSSARFGSVSGSWRQPAAKCTAGHESFSAVWVGLGGYREGARALQQIGTDANCTSSGRAIYAAWWELLPSDPVELKLRVNPGDRIAASVTTSGSRVTLRLRNLTSGARFSTTRHYSRPDVSTAEWIVEAPSTCATASACTTVPLANFGSVSFSSATATAHGHTGTILDPGWSALALELRQGSNEVEAGRAGFDVRAAGAVRQAAPSAASSAGAFSVTWSESSRQTEPPSAPTLPGFGGGG